MSGLYTTPSRYRETRSTVHKEEANPARLRYCKRSPGEALTDNAWRDLLERRKRSKEKIQEIKAQVEDAQKTLLKIERRSNEHREFIYSTPSIQYSVRPRSEREPKILRLSYADFKRPSKIDWETKTSLRNSENPHSFAYFIIHEREAAFVTFPLVLESHATSLSNKIKDDRNNKLLLETEVHFLIVVCHWTQIFPKNLEPKFLLCSSEVANEKTHTDAYSSYQIVSNAQFEIVDSGIDDEGEEWEYYSDYEEKATNTNKEVALFPKVPISLLERWNTSIWASDDEDESDFYSSTSSTSDFSDDYVEFDYTDDRLFRWVTDIKNFKNERFLKKQFGNEIANSRFRKTATKEIVIEYLYNYKSCGYFREFHRGEFHSFGTVKLLIDSKGTRKPVKCRTIWLRLPGNAFCVFKDTNSSLYLYPDLTTAIVGPFDEYGNLQGSATYGQVTSIELQNSVPLPIVTISCDIEPISFDPSTSVIISKTPLIEDHYERQTVYVSDSKIPFAGQGLFCRRSIRPNTLLALFNGVRRRDANSHRGKWSFITSDYRIALDRNIALDIPAGTESLKKYRATLGHKCCHSFTPNSTFEELYHPRFGHIMSVVSLRDMRIGEEITVSYNYDVGRAPQWYRDSWFQHLREHEEYNEESLQMMANKLSNQLGTTIEVPPPPNDSSFFIPCGECKNHVGFKGWTLSCTECENWFHFKCIIGVEEEDFQSAFKCGEELNWKCSKCEQ